MTKYKTPYADLIPPQSTDERTALEADIKKRGQIDPAYVDEDDNILDGHHRHSILGSKLRVAVVSGLSDAQKEAFVFRTNNVRRNLSPSQQHELRSKMQATAFKLRSEDHRKWTDATVAAELGVARETVRDWLRTNGVSAKTSTPKPDARVKVEAAAKPKIARRVKAGETQSQVAADYGISQKQVSNIVRGEKKKAAKKRSRAQTANAAKGKAVAGIVNGDFRKVGVKVADDSCALVFTDPPYDRDSLPMFDDLGKFANRILVDGGSLITFCGQYVLPDVIESLSVHLRFFWICCCLHTGATAQMREYGIKVKWKPMLWFVKGTFRRDRERWVDDLVRSKEEKSEHDWQQSEKEASYYINGLTDKDELVVDPFCGGGTTAFAAQSLSRRFWTCEVNRTSYGVAKGRLSS